MMKGSGTLDLERACQSTSPSQKAGEERGTDSTIGQHGFSHYSEITLIPPAILHKCANYVKPNFKTFLFALNFSFNLVSRAFF
jgi:hypothetical protein